MMNILKKNLVLTLNILLAICVLPLLFILSVVNLENIFQLNFSDTYTIVYFVYLFLSISLIFFFRFFKISNNTVKDEVWYTVKQILLLTLLVIPSFFINHSFMLEHLWESNLYLRSYWRIAFFYFALALCVSPLLKILKYEKGREYLILSRKVFWILSFIFFLKHWLEYFASEYIFQAQYHANVPYLVYVYDNLLVRTDALSWVIAWILMFLLWITSNKISVKLLSWKWWKSLQSTVYPAFLISVIHVAFASRFDNFYTFLLVLVVTLRTISYISNKKTSTDNTDKTTTKYICIPCGYIYDESKWDPDGWIIPGTKFEDIPDDWYCPVCWVWKSDFEPYYENENNIFWWYLWQVVSTNMLTEDVLELSINLNTNVKVLKGQYAILILKDFDWEFSRAYSIVDSKNNILTFWIKLSETWRWWRTLKNVKLWDTIKVKWIYGEFVLKNTTNPKVFIATWTWLSPIMNMISEKLQSNDNYLFFWAQMEKDLFYLDKINQVENLSVNIYISREKTEKYNNWRIDLTSFVFAPETEFYICWNPWVVSSTKEFLINAWYKNIYIEKF